jgi:hypothetical protein
MARDYKRARAKILAEIDLHSAQQAKYDAAREKLEDLRIAQTLEDLYASQDERLEDMRRQLETERRDARWGRR